MTTRATLFSLIFAIFMAFTPACGDDGQPNPGPNPPADGSVPAADGLAAKVDSGDPSLPPCKLDISKIIALHLFYSDILHVEGKNGSVRATSDILLTTPKGFSEKVRSGLTGIFTASVPLFGKGPSLGIADNQPLSITIINETCKTVSGHIVIKAYDELN